MDEKVRLARQYRKEIQKLEAQQDHLYQEALKKLKIVPNSLIEGFAVDYFFNGLDRLERLLQ